MESINLHDLYYAAPSWYPLHWPPSPNEPDTLTLSALPTSMTELSLCAPITRLSDLHYLHDLAQPASFHRAPNYAAWSPWPNQPGQLPLCAQLSSMESIKLPGSYYALNRVLRAQPTESHSIIALTALHGPNQPLWNQPSKCVPDLSPTDLHEINQPLWNHSTSPPPDVCLTDLYDLHHLT